MIKLFIPMALMLSSTSGVAPEAGCYKFKFVQEDVAVTVELNITSESTMDFGIEFPKFDDSYPLSLACKDEPYTFNISTSEINISSEAMSPCMQKLADHFPDEVKFPVHLYYDSVKVLFAAEIVVPVQLVKVSVCELFVNALGVGPTPQSVDAMATKASNFSEISPIILTSIILALVL